MTALQRDSTAELLLAYESGRNASAAGEELVRRGVLDARPRWPAGQYAAFLVARACKGMRTVGTAPAYHVVADGARIQVHGRHVHGREPLWIPIHLREEQDFDTLAFVRFEHDFSVGEAWLLPFESVTRHAKIADGQPRLRLAAAWRGDARVRRLSLR